MYATRHSDIGADDRAASALVGLVLLFGLVFAGAGIIYWAGMDAKQSIQSASEVDSAETSLQEVSTKLSTLSFKGDGAVTSFDLSGKDPSDVEIVDDGEIRFELNGNGACTASSDLGSIVYENDNGDTVAYQAGAVFKRTESGVTIVQSPELEYETEVVDGTNVRTLRFPITNVDGDVKSSGTVTASPNRSTSETFEEDLCLAGSKTDEIDYVREITITVDGSSYYEAWAQYFREEFGAAGTVTVDDANQKVTLEAPLGSGVTPDQFTIDDEKIYGAIFSGSSSGELLLQTQHATVDSYDSSNGPWGGSEPTYGSDGDIITRGDVAVQANGALVDGNVYAEGVVELSNSCGGGGSNCVSGDVYVNNSTAGPGGPSTDFTSPSGNTEDMIGGDAGNGTVVPDIPTMDAQIDETLATVDEYNNNDDTGVDGVDGRALDFDGGSATIESGVYYLDDFTVPSGNTLTLDTSGGDIVFAVDGDVDIGSDARVEVTGGGQVRTFVAEPTGSDDQLTVRDGATVTVTDGGTPTYRSNAFFVACKAGCSATFEKATGGTATQFTGVLYGPGEEADDGTVKLGKDAQVWGALVAGKVDFEKQSQFHFDTTLKNSELDADGDGTPDVVDTNDGFPDGDGDGFSESEDDCPDSHGTGENGCDGVSEDEDANTLIVNQSRATLTIIGSQIANERIVEEEVETRAPLNVELVIDDSGSMWTGEDYEGGAYQTEGWTAWSSWETVDDAAYVSQGTSSPPSGTAWQVEYEYTETGNCNSDDTPPCQTYTLQEVVNSDESFNFDSDDSVRRSTYTEDVTVPDGMVYVADDDGDSNYENDGKIFYPGETIDSDNWPYYHEYEFDGSDPYYERLDASNAFLDALDPSKDKVGILQFYHDIDELHDVETEGSDFAGARDELDRSEWYSSGQTNLAESLTRATENLKATSETRDGEDVTKTIVLLTDGEHCINDPDGDIYSCDDESDWDGDGTVESPDQEIRDIADEAHDAGIRIYVVALGDESDYNKPLLEDIANTDNPETDGRLYEVENAADLTEKFEDIAEDTTKSQKQIIQHTNTSTTIHMGGDDVFFGGNTNPYDGSYPSTTVDADLDVGDAVHFSSTMYQCDGNTTFDTTTGPGGDEYDEAYCENTGSADAQTTNGDDTNHRIFTDGDTIPTVDTSAWYKDASRNSLEKIVEDYDASLTDGNTFSIPKNDAIILVEIEDGESDDRDFMVVYFDANDQDPPNPDDQTVATLSDDDDDDDGSPGDGTANDFVVSITSSDVNVTGSSPSVAPFAATVTAPSDTDGTAHDVTSSARTPTLRVGARD